MIIFTLSDKPTSTTPRKMATAMVTTKTTPVDFKVACRVGQVTRLNSDITSVKNFPIFLKKFTCFVSLLV